jgi:carbonic anhydrase/acetyltransferase-like protein (isoleucine patch superfamily)
VTLGDNVSVWPGSTLRGDEDAIIIGANTNIQENCVIHCDPGYPAKIGESCLIGHGAILHGCTVERGSLVGMGAVLLDGCVIGEGSCVAAGALVTQNMVIPPHSMVMGVPGKVTRPMDPAFLDKTVKDCEKYVALAQELLPEAKG